MKIHATGHRTCQPPQSPCDRIRACFERIARPAARPLFASFDSFDIAEAYAVLEWDWNVNGWLRERPSNQRRRESISCQLARLKFGARPNLSFRNLSRNGKAIYLNATRRLGLRKGCVSR